MRREPGRLVFVDETSVKTNMTPLRGRSLRGARLLAEAPFGRWRTQTFIAGLRCNELIAPWVVDGAMNGLAFDAYVRTQLAPRLDPGDVVILDNLNVHKSPRAAQALAERGAWFLFLPKYSPDLNPIEQAFAKLKTPAPKGESANLRRPLARRRRHLRSLPARRMLELPQKRWLCCRLIARRSSAWRARMSARSMLSL